MISMITKLQLVKFYFQTALICYREEKKFYLQLDYSAK